MAPKNKNKALEADEILQAVVIADSFNQRFMPLTKDLPRCLLPLCNIPLIEYTLESLASAGMHEIFIICSSHADFVVNYINNSKWGHSTYPFVTTIVSKEIASIGDALREIDAKQILYSDFILVSGNIVTNLDLGELLRKHLKRKEQDKHCIMTMLMKSAGKEHRSRQWGEESLYVLDAATNACLYYSPLLHFPHTAFTNIPLENLKNHPNILLKTDLIDAQIDICSLEVPALFTENFDYQNIRTDFVKGVIESDILGKTIYLEQVSGYCARVYGTESYDAVSKDVMERWAYPMVPESSIFNPHHTLINSSYYKGNNVSLARSTRIKGRVVIGHDCSIKSNTKIEDCVLGNKCVIGKNCVLKNCYLFDGCVIGDEVEMNFSVLASQVYVGDQVKIGKGCVFGQGVQVPATKIVKENGKYFCALDNTFKLWQCVEEEEEELVEDMRNVQLGEMGRDFSNVIKEEWVETESEDEESEEEYDQEAEKVLEKEHMFVELKATFNRSVLENHSPENAILELNTLKMAMNVEFEDLRMVYLPIILDQIDVHRSTDSTRLLLTKWLPLIVKFMHQGDGKHVIEVCAQWCKVKKLFAVVVTVLYDLEVVDEEEILRWYNKSEGEVEFEGVRSQLTKLVEWLNKSDEESDEEESDDE